MDELYYRVSSIGKAVNKSYTSLYFSVFFSFPIAIPLYILKEFFCWCLPRDIAMQKSIGKNFIGVSVCIFQISGSNYTS